MKKPFGLCVKGQGLTEYLILLVLIAIVSIAATRTLGSRINEKIKKAGEKVHEGITFSDNH